MDVVDTPEEAGELELPPLVVREPLERFLDGHGIGSGRVEAERIGDGHSNITFLVRRGDARVVLRRPPRPPLPPSAHDVLREARLLRALESTPVRVPRVLAVGDDEGVLGVPFYVMEEVRGHVPAASLPEATTASDPDPARTRRDRGVEGFVDLLAAGPDALGRFHARAAALVRPHVGTWRSTWEAGPLAATEATGAQLDALERGDDTHLRSSSVHALPPPPNERRWGCCGTLGTYLPAV